MLVENTTNFATRRKVELLLVRYVSHTPLVDYRYKYSQSLQVRDATNTYARSIKVIFAVRRFFYSDSYSTVRVPRHELRGKFERSPVADAKVLSKTVLASTQ